ncbi:MAG: serine/threonine-protein kinase, partial [Bacteroidota bacterium]
MNADRWRRIESVFGEAADLAPEARAAFLDDACRTASGDPDPALRAEVEAMLGVEGSASDFFDEAADRLAEEAAALTSRPPEHAGPWRPVELVARGGMGEVYRAERTGADAPEGFAQEAALKLVQPGLAPDLVARFHAERRILAGLDHPGIARMLDGGTASDGRPYLAMEFVRGEPITTYCDRHRLSVDQRLGLFAQVCDAVAFAHARLIVHRDLKPGNILVASGEAGNGGNGPSPVAENASGARGATPLATRAPRVKLLDFGVARLLGPEASGATRTTLHALTPEYAAPEQLRGDAPTTAADVYALGVLLYELLAGQRPFHLPQRLAMEAARVVLEETPTDPSAAVRITAASGARGSTSRPATLSPEAVAEARATRPERLARRLRGDLDRIAQMALRKEPDRRYTSAAALGQDVRRHLGGLPVEARPATVGYRVGRFVRRHRAAVASGVMALALLLVYAATVTVQRAQIAEERDRAERVADVLGTLFSGANPYVDGDDGLDAETPLASALFASALRVDSAFAEDPATRFDLLASLAGSLAGVGADSLARDVHALNRQRAEATFGPDDPRLVSALRAEGGLLRERARGPEDLAMADSLLRRALALAERVHGPQARETGEAAIELSTLLKDNGAAEEAEPLAARGVQIARRHRPEADLATALTIHALALGRLGETDAAWEASREAVQIVRGERDAGSANLIGALANAATAAKESGRDDEALALEAEAAEIAVATLGADHPTTLTVRANYATTLQQLGRYDEAEREHRAVLAVRLSRFGPLSFDAGAS